MYISQSTTSTFRIIVDVFGFAFSATSLRSYLYILSELFALLLKTHYASRAGISPNPNAVEVVKSSCMVCLKAANRREEKNGSEREGRNPKIPSLLAASTSKTVMRRSGRLFTAKMIDDRESSPKFEIV